MKTSPLILPLLIFIGLLGITRGDDWSPKDKIPQKSLHALMDKLQGQVPAGWTVSYNEEFHLVDITRDKLTRIDYIAPNPPPMEEDKSAMGHFSFSLRVLPFLAMTEYKKEQAENRETNKKMSAIYDVLAKSPTVHGIREPVMGEPHIISTNPEETAKIDEYNRLEAILHKLPDGYFDQISMSWVPPFSTLGEGPTPTDEGGRRECDAVYKKLIEVPSKY